MHYIHSLTHRQKRILIWVFVVVPFLFFAGLFALWAYNSGLFKEYITLRTVVPTADGLDSKSPVTLSGIKIGSVTGFKLNDKDQIDVTLQVEKEYHSRIHTDATAAVSSLVIFGQKKIRINGGTPEEPLINTGATLPLVKEELEMEKIMERLKPLVNAAENALKKFAEIINTFPNQEMNRTVKDISAVMNTIREGRSSAGRLLSTDGAALFEKLDGLTAKLNNISADIEKASDHIPDTLKNTKDLSGSAASILRRVDETSGDLNVNEIQTVLLSLLRNMDTTVKSLSELAPAISKAAESLNTTADEVQNITPKIPVLLDDVEMMLNEYLMLVQSLKTAWPVKNFVPPEEEKPDFGGAERAGPYGGGR